MSSLLSSTADIDFFASLPVYRTGLNQSSSQFYSSSSTNNNTDVFFDLVDPVQPSNSTQKLISIDLTANSLLPLYRDPRMLILPISIITGLGLFFKAFYLTASDIEFIGIRGTGYEYTRGWCILGDFWLSAIISTFSLFHFFDLLNIFKLYPYRSMMRKQYPGTGRCLNTTIFAYSSLFCIFIINSLWWIYTQTELRTKWILTGHDWAHFARQINIGFYILCFIYCILLLWLIGLAVQMRIQVVSFPKPITEPHVNYDSIDD